MGNFNDGMLWLAAVNLTIWTGLFLYLLRIERKLDRQAAVSPRSEEIHDE